MIISGFSRLKFGVIWKGHPLDLYSVGVLQHTHEAAFCKPFVVIYKLLKPSQIERTNLYSFVVSAIQVNDSRFLESDKQWAGCISRLGQRFKLTI